ncbi:restriction endonuclease [Paenibacillus campi]|uniref:restriction endonuclease n=1 Tax=Paenibacillus campi TaxID=3106031 RepID=UPI002AFEC2C6|nr:restriction endonuclease [Paenibacillus sp. SGZ-1009]
MSNFAQIYDKLIAKEKLKNGSKYERLAAVVYKLIDESDSVIHDLRLRGDGKTAQHQIDVTVEKSGISKRILIECKEYNKVIGIGIIRDFFGAIMQIKPDEAFVVTTVGYTKGAIDFAKDEGIKLAILREAEDSDWDGLIRTIKLNMKLIMMKTPTITWIACSEVEKQKTDQLLEENLEKIKSLNTQDEFFYDNDFNITSNYQDVLSPILNAAPRVPNQLTKGEHEFESKRYIKILDHFVAIKGFKYEFYSYFNESHSIIDDGGKVAALLFKVLKSNSKHLIFEEEIEKWMFDKNGSVVPKNDQE